MKKFRNYAAPTIAMIMSLMAFTIKNTPAQGSNTAALSAQQLLKQATQTAQEENKNILLHFGASW